MPISPLLRRPVFCVESSATIPHAPEAVYAALASVEGALRWQAGVRVVRRPANRFYGPLVVRYEALGARHALTARVTAAEPPHRFAYRAEGTAFVLEATYRVEAAPGGTRVACRVNLTTRARAATEAAADSGPLARPAPDDVALRRLLARRVAGDLVRLGAWIDVRQRARS